MASLQMLISEIDSQQIDRAILCINFDLNPMDECVTLSINAGDEFDFHLDDLKRAIESIITFKADYS